MDKVKSASLSIVKSAAKVSRDNQTNKKIKYYQKQGKKLNPPRVCILPPNPRKIRNFLDKFQIGKTSIQKVKLDVVCDIKCCICQKENAGSHDLSEKSPYSDETMHDVLETILIRQVHASMMLCDSCWLMTKNFDMYTKAAYTIQNKFQTMLEQSSFDVSVPVPAMSEEEPELDEIDFINTENEHELILKSENDEPQAAIVVHEIQMYDFALKEEVVDEDEIMNDMQCNFIDSENETENEESSTVYENTPLSILSVESLVTATSKRQVDISDHNETSNSSLSKNDMAAIQSELTTASKSKIQRATNAKDVGVCHVCGEEIHLKGRLMEIHMSMKHGGERIKRKLNKNLPCMRKFPCEKCGKLYPLGLLMDRHLLLAHEDKSKEPSSAKKQRILAPDEHPDKLEKNELLLECFICGVKKTKNRLHEHMLAHSSVSRNVCPLCPASFRKRKDLKFHIVRKHPENYEPIDNYICLVCTTRTTVFDDFDKLRSHMEEAHEIKQTPRKKKNTGYERIGDLRTNRMQKLQEVAEKMESKNMPIQTFKSLQKYFPKSDEAT